MPKSKRRILVAPLDWGLGHATRCVPLIRLLLERGAEVVVASSGDAGLFLQKEFPGLHHVTLPAYKPVYPAGDGSMVWKMAGQLPRFVQAIAAEHQQTERLVRHEKIDVVISDNRYGCYAAKAKSVLIYHQLHLLMPDRWKWMEGIVNRFNEAQVKKFDACWVPAPSSLFFPALTSSSLPHTFIGFLSRLRFISLPEKYKMIAICSGPEPQRTAFEALLMEALLKHEAPCLLVRGVVEAQSEMQQVGKHLWVANYLNSEDLNHAICQSRVVIARSGYSTMMDLINTRSHAVFVPTPGQTEQEYIAAQLMQQRVAYTMQQRHFDLEKALKETKKFAGFVNFEREQSHLPHVIDTVL